MKKQLIPLFVMSIISVIISVIMLGMGIWAIAAKKTLTDNATDMGDGLLALLAVFSTIVIILFVVIVLIIFAATVLLGVFGLVCSLKNGHFSLVCVILGSIGTVLSLSGVPALLESITNDFEPIYLMPFIYFGGYTACAVIAFLYKKGCTRTDYGNGIPASKK